MAMEPKKRGIFCMETVWYDSKDQTSIRPMLEMLRDSFLEVPFIHRIAVTKDAFRHHLEEWHDNADHFPILYLGYHGKPNYLFLGGSGYHRDEKVDLCEELARYLGTNCKHCLVHLASCAALAIGTKDLCGLVDKTGVVAISGYSKEIKWMESAAFELYYLQRLQFMGGPQNLTPNFMNSVRKGVEGKFPPLCTGQEPLAEFGKKLLGFKLQVQDKKKS